MEEHIAERLGGGESAEQLARKLVYLNNTPQPGRRRIYQAALEVLLDILTSLLGRAA